MFINKLVLATLRLGMLILLLATIASRAEECRTTPGWDAMDTVTIRLTAEHAQEAFSLTIREADSANERAAGYQWICETQASDTAILFVFSRMVSSAFHMKNVNVPLDIHFFNETGQQVDALVMRPEPPGSSVKPRYYRPSGSFRYALEIARPHSHDLNSTPAPLRLHIDSL